MREPDDPIEVRLRETEAACDAAEGGDPAVYSAAVSAHVKQVSVYCQAIAEGMVQRRLAREAAAEARRSPQAAPKRHLRLIAGGGDPDTGSAA